MKIHLYEEKIKKYVLSDCLQVTNIYNPSMNIMLMYNVIKEFLEEHIILKDISSKYFTVYISEDTKDKNYVIVKIHYNSKKYSCKTVNTYLMNIHKDINVLHGYLKNEFESVLNNIIFTTKER